MSSETPIQNIHWDGKTVVLDIAGEIDLHSSKELQAGLMDAVKDSPTRMVINLAEVNYMDSSGVASLVKLLGRTKQLGVELKLAAPTTKVRAIFEITRLDHVFTICPDLETALA